ncbi:hypothetical protein HYW46_02080 [Candidatus Daviesbacteria bacterium]|nr:hypothetical protein [Candidatus Daviesbacteria bacterium]
MADAGIKGVVAEAPKNLFGASKDLAKDTVGEMIEEGKQQVQGYPGAQTPQQQQQKQQQEQLEQQKKAKEVGRIKQFFATIKQDQERLAQEKEFFEKEEEQKEIKEEQKVKQLEVVKKNEREEKEQIAVQRKRAKVENKGVGGG